MNKIVKLSALALGVATMLNISTAQASDEAKANVFYYSLNDTFINNLSSKMSAAAQSLNIKITAFDAGDDLIKQLNQVEVALSNSKDPLIVNPVDALNGEAVLQYAKKAKVPVIFFNRKPSDEVLASYQDAWYVGTNAGKAGEYQAEILIDYLKAHPEYDKNGNGVLDYVLLKGEATHYDTQLRTSAFMHTMQKAGIKTKPLVVANCNWSYAQASDEMQRVNLRFGFDEVEAVISNNDAMALGALNQLQDAGYNKGDSSKFIPVIGIDATDAAVEAVMRGQMLGTVLNDAVSISEVCLKIAKAYSNEETITEDVVGYPIDNRQIEVPYVKYTMK